MEKSTTRKELDGLRDKIEETVTTYIEDLRCADEHVTDEDIIDSGRYLIELGNAIIARFK